MKKMNRWIALLIACMFVAGCSSNAVKQDSSSSKTPSSEVASGLSNIQVKFTQEGDHPEEAIIDLIDGATSTLDIAIYSINFGPIVDAVLEAADRGVNVRIISDLNHAEEKAKQKKALDRMKSSGIPIKVNTHDGKMHLKMMVADSNKVEAGSFNYLKSSIAENDDVAVIIEDEAVGKQFEDAFNNMWNNTDRFGDYK